MAQIPNSFVLEGLRKLAGGARVTYLDEKRTIKRVERLVKMPRNAWDIPFYTVDVEHSTALLVQQTKSGEDQQFAEIYRIYETLPGELRYSISFPYGGLTGFPRLNVQQNVRADLQVFEAPGSPCPIEGYPTGVLITQAYAESEYPAVRVNTRVYDIIPSAAQQTGFGYSLSYPYGGLTAFPRITWNFQVAKGAYVAAAPGSACPIAGYTSAVLISEQVQSSSEQSQVLTVTRIYDVIPASSAQQGFGYSLSFPYGGLNANPRITWNFKVALAGYAPASSGSACPIAGYTSAVLVSERTQGASEQNQMIVVERIYDIIPNATQQQGFGYDVSYPYGGLTANPRVTWRFSLARASYAAAAPGSACPITGYTGAVLVSETMQGATEQSQIIVVTRTFDIVPAASAQQGFGYSVSYVDGHTSFPALSWVFQIAASAYAAVGALTGCPIAGFTGLLLVDQQMQGATEQGQVVTVTRKYETLPGPLSFEVDYDNNQISNPIVTLKQRMALNNIVVGTEGATHCPWAGYEALVLFEQHVNPTNFTWVREYVGIYEFNPSNVLTTYDLDQDLQVWVRTTRQKVLAGNLIGIDGNVMEVKQTAIDRWRSIQIVTSLYNLPPAVGQFKTGQWPFPELLSNITVTARRIGDAFYQSAFGWNQRPRYECSVMPTWLRTLKNVQALFYVHTSFFYGSAGFPTIALYTAPTRDVFYTGVTFRFDFRNVLCNAMGPNMSFAGVGDGKYGDIVENVQFTATNPSASTYYSQIGSWQVVGVEQERYRGDVYVQQRTQVLLQ